MTTLTIKDITNLYLYKNEDLPENRLDESIISNSKNGTKTIDKKDFMTGPGRFVKADDFDIVRLFFNVRKQWLIAPQNPHILSPKEKILANLAPGKYSKAQILEMLGYTKNGEKVAGMFAGETQTLGFYDDGKGDLLERAYIWNTTAFKVRDNTEGHPEKDLYFVVEESGKRYIENFGIEPLNKQENFDFDGGFWSGLVNLGLESIIDPSGIGKTVKLDFTGEVDTYTLDEAGFRAQAAKKSHWSLINAAKVYEGLDKIIKSLWESGSIKHLHKDETDGKLKPIIYGTAGNDSKIEGTKITRRIAGKEVTIDIASQKIEKSVLGGITGSRLADMLLGGISNDDPGMSSQFDKQDVVDLLTKLDNPLAPYTKNGVVYVMGGGDDKVKGTKYNDLLYGGEGSDTLEGDKGEDIYYADGGDTIIDSDGKGKVYFLTDDVKKDFITLPDEKKDEYRLKYAILSKYKPGSTTAVFDWDFLDGVGLREAYNEYYGSPSDDKKHLLRGSEDFFGAYAKYRYEATGLKLPAEKPDSEVVKFTADTLKITPIDDSGKAIGKSITIKNFTNGQLGIYLLDILSSIYPYYGGLDSFYAYNPNNTWGGRGHNANRNNASDLNSPDNSNGNNGGSSSSHQRHSSGRGGNSGGNGGSGDNNNENSGGSPNRPGRNYEAYDPLVLDLDGDGIETIAHNGTNGALFDHNADGIRTATGWLHSDDGFLALDRNNDGIINDNSELFSDSVALSDSQFARHGFMALAALDENQDGVINEQDSLFSQLRIWRDLNQDGESTPNELFTLKEQGIRALHTAYEETDRELNGHNFLSQIGKYEKEDGSFGEMGDVNFSFNPFYSRFVEQINLTDTQKNTANLSGVGRVRDLREAAALSDKLNTILAQYSKLESRQAQQALLPELLAAWAQTDKNYRAYNRTLEKTVESSDADAVTVRVTPSQLQALRNAKHDPAVMARFEQNKQKISALNSLYGLNIAQLYYTTDKDIDYITNKVNRLYQNTLDLAYQSLLLQTRLKKYHDSVVITKDKHRLVSDYSKTIGLFKETFEKSPLDGLTDLGEYLTLLPSAKKWPEGLALLSEYIQHARENGYFTAWKESSAFMFSALKEAGITLAEHTELKGNDKNNILIGNNEHNKISAYDGDDILIGGKGNDILEGGYGADTYIFSKGHGQDTVYEDTNSEHREHDIDTLHFTDVNYAEVKFRREGDDLVLFGYHENDSVTMKYFYHNKDRQFDRLVFADRTLTRDELIKEGIHLYGTDSNDVIRDHADWDSTLEGGKGNDILEGGYGADTYIFSKGHGQDTVYENTDSKHREHDINTLHFTDVNYAEVKFRRKDNDLVLFGYHENDSVTMKHFYNHVDYQFNRLVFADRTLTRDELRAEGMALFGTENNDTIHDWHYNSVIQAGDGNDTINANEGDDTLIGGKGNDILAGGYGADTYIFSKGHGQDTVYEDTNDSHRKHDIDTLHFTDVNYAEVKFRREGDDLVLFGYHENDSVTMKYFYHNKDRQFDRLVFADRTLTRDELIKEGIHLYGTDSNDVIRDHADWDSTLEGGKGNDILEGGYGADTYIFSKGHGQDTVYETTNDSHRKHDIDTLHFTDVNYAEVKFRRKDNDLVLFGYHENDSVTIKYFYNHVDYQFDRLVFADCTLTRNELRAEGMALFGTENNDTIHDWHYNSVIQAGDGDDKVYASDGDDTLIGGKGNDILDGGYGADTYIFSKGHGQDTVYENTDSEHREHDIDTLHFTDVNYAEVKFRREGDDLVLFGYHENDSVTMKYFYHNKDRQFDRLVFADRTLTRDELIKEGLHLYGTDGNDIIRDHADWDSTLEGGKGNDILEGGYGADTYIFSKGHGQDTVYETTNDSHRKHDIDTLHFTDVNYAEVKFRRKDNDLVLFGYHENDSVTMKHFYNHVDYQFNRLVFADRTLTRDELRAEGMALFGTENNDTIHDWHYNSVIRAGDGDDKVYASDGDDTLIGGKGNDILDGGYGADTYIFSKGHGQDTVYETTNDSHRKHDIDTLHFTDVNYAEVKFHRKDNDLVLFGYHENDSVTMKYFYNHVDYQFDRLVFADRTLTRDELIKEGIHLYGTDGNDVIRDHADWDSTLEGGKGNDILEGGYGADTYIFSKGHGQDTVYENTDSKHREHDINTLHFTDVNYAEVKFRRKDNDLVLFGYHENDSVTMKHFYNHVDYQFNRLVFADRTLTRDELRAEGMALFGTENDDTIYDWHYNSVIRAGDGNDTINANEGDDTLIGGKGNDILAGGYGADTYIFSKGHGQDTVYEDTNSEHREHDIDTLHFTDVNYAEVKFRREGDDLVLFGYHENDSVTMKYFYNHVDYQFDRLVFADRTLTRDELRAEGMALFGTENNDTIHDWHYNSVIRAGDGNDTINANEGDDTLIGGKGNDILKGGYGADTYIFSKGHGQDIVYEDTNDSHRKHDIDTLHFTDVDNLSELWFSRENNSLIIRSLLNEDKVTVQHWYSHQDHKIENIRLSDNQTLAITQVEKLVEAMAGFAQQYGGDISLAPQEEVKQYINSLAVTL